MTTDKLCNDGEVKKIAFDAAHKVLAEIGINSVDTDKAIEWQQIMAWVKAEKLERETMKKRAKLVLVAIITAGIVSAFWDGLVSSIQHTLK